MAQWVMNLASIYKDAGLNPGLARCVKNPALPEMWCRSLMHLGLFCCGCGLGWQLSYQLDP